MLTYTFSRREKAMLLALALILVALVWFVVVYQGTANQITTLEGEISAAEVEATAATSQVSRMHAMQKAIDEYKAKGEKATPIPTFDNMTPLMTSLNSVMSRADTYQLKFDDLDTETSKSYVLRGVTVDFGCDSFTAAESLITALAKNTYPCSIDSVSISNNSSAKSSSRVTTGSGAAGSSAISASVHVTYYEKPSTKR